ncbi:LysM peptidoglycan-binding domain-containing protein [Longilinea arvoryzae]|nr:LysM peptidoglycan-binding domain-containing protein [Longilinea arvoryzae]
MHQPNKTRWILLLTLLAALFTSAAAGPNFTSIHAAPLRSDVNAYDLIAAMNALRVANGLPALVEDPIIDAVAQSTAQIMAANNMSWHIGDVSGRLQSAGYGGGAKVWGTENFAVGDMTLDEIMVIWSDASHMIPAVNPAYCNVGAGIADAGGGRYYYVLQAAYTSGKSCGEYTSPVGATPGAGHTGSYGIIVPVEVSTPGADGKIYHEVKSGQSLWSIAIAYHVTIKDIQTWNNLSSSITLQIGQKLFIPDKDTVGYATPTPADMVQKSTPDADGKIIHTVAAYNTLSTIADAYDVSVETILALNGLQADWPLQIGQKILIYPGNITPSPTPRPLTPIEKLTPAADGKYYHTVQSGEYLSWIADLYGVNITDLMAWNNLNSGSILQLNQKLVLQVTPPATATPTLGPATETPTPTPVTPTVTPTLTPTPTQTLTPTPKPLISLTGGTPWVGGSIVGLLIGIAVIVMLMRKKR